MLHRAWLLLAILSVLVQDSDAECAETNRRNLSGLVGVGYDLLTDTVKEAVYEEKGFYNRDDICSAVPEVADVSNEHADNPTHAANIERYCHDDYSLQQFVELTALGPKLQRFYKEKGVPAGAFGQAFLQGRELLTEADACVVIGQKQRYDMELQIRGASAISSRFKNRVIRIAKALKEGSTELAKYRAETLVRDYGTHVIKRAIGYAQRIMIGRIDNRKMRAHNLDPYKDLQLNMEAHFNGMADKSEWFKQRDGRVVKLREKGMISTVHEDYTIEKHAPLPRELSRMSDFVKNIDPTPSHNVSKLVEEVISKYYVANTHPGCMQVNASNFDSHANVDDGSCLEYTVFGGFFDNSTKHNPLSSTQTGKKECETRFEAILVYEHMFDGVQPLYWCHSSNAEQMHYEYKAYFGGIYRSKNKYNALTKANGCPDGYESTGLWSYSQDVIICYDEVMRDKDAYELSRMKVIDPNYDSFVCPPKYERVDFDYKEEGSVKLVIAACVHKGIFAGSDIIAIRDQYHALRELPFSKVTDTDGAATKEDDLPIAVIAGSVVAVLLCIIIIIIVIAFCIIRRKKSCSSSLPGAQPPKGSKPSSAFNRSKTAPNTARTVQSKTPRTVSSNTQATPKKA